MPSWLLIGWWLSLGVAPEQMQRIDNVAVDFGVANRVMAYTDIGISATVADRVRLSASVETYAFADSVVSFAPYYTSYKVAVEARISSYVYATIDHTCDHTVYNGLILPDGSELPTLGGNLTRAYVTIRSPRNW